MLVFRLRTGCTAKKDFDFRKNSEKLISVLDIYNFDFRKRLASFGPRPVQSKRLKVKKESRSMRVATFQTLLTGIL